MVPPLLFSTGLPIIQATGSSLLAVGMVGLTTSVSDEIRASWTGRSRPFFTPSWMSFCIGRREFALTTAIGNLSMTSRFMGPG